MNYILLFFICKTFILFEDFLPDNFSFENNNVKYKLYEAYCPIDQEIERGKCTTVNQVVSASTVFLFNYLFTEDQYIETDDKNNEYSMYIMLWLSNKMKLLTQKDYGTVSEFYDTFIQNDEHYKEYLERINSTKNIMNIKIGEMRTLYGLLNELCNAIIKYNNDSSISDFSIFVNNWEKQYKQLVEKKKKVSEDEHYCEVLLTLKSAYQKFKKDNNIQKNFPEIKEGDINYCKKIRSETNTSWKVIDVKSIEKVKKEKGLEKGKDSFGYIDVFKKTFETYSSNFIITFTSISNNLYETMLPKLKNLYYKSINFGDQTINYVNDYFNNIIETYTIDNGKPKIQALRDGSSSSSNDLPSPQDPGIKVTGNGITEIGDNPLIVYKKVGFSIIILLISIALAIMYKVNKKKIVKYTIFKILPHYKILYIFHNFMLVFAIWMEKEIEEKKKHEKGYKYV
ncbi:hypothetical protein YYC_02108 [Plasmodium yoelii 17X]|uniref:Uncharacterized protein n=1 Tax=Plasmodium yoelii 17X TaxID=1323249 RepID=V7PR27_PLAYE|nr:hypothetical protein YYC_02108 [Plasmodium yoelii 17X]